LHNVGRRYRSIASNFRSDGNQLWSITLSGGEIMQSPFNWCFDRLLQPYWWCSCIVDIWRKPLKTEQSLVGDFVYLRQHIAKAVVKPGPDGNWIVRTELGNQAATVQTQNVTSAPAKDALEWLYGALTTLDQMASALMRLNGVMVAAAAFLLRRQSLEEAEVVSTSIAWIAVFSSVSIGMCLFVVAMDWQSLGLVRNEGNQIDYTNEIFHLQRIAAWRQRIYRIAWWVSLIATGMFVYEFLSIL
jgi:hypothetical protein